MSTQRTQPLYEKTDFDTLLDYLTCAWWSHQELRAAGAPIADLAASSLDLFQSRMAMGSWHRQNRD